MAALRQHIVQNRKSFAVFEELKQELRGYSLESVEELCGIRAQTMYMWLSGKTRFPHLRTIVKVADAIGFDVTLKRRASRSAHVKLRAVK